MDEPANDEAQRTGHKPATIAFPKRALWPGPLQRKVRRRDHGPQAPHAIDDGRAQWPATTAQWPPRHDGRSPTGHRRRPQHGTDRCGYRRRRMPRAPAHAPLPEPANDKAQRTGRYCNRCMTRTLHAAGSAAARG